MSIKTYFNNFHYKKTYSALEKVIFRVLYPVSFSYKIISKIRILLYNANIIKSEHPDAKIISIGNLTTGGTGKTPTVIEFAKYLTSNSNSKVAILSRGYGAKKKKEINVVKINNDLIANSPSDCGDEAFMMATVLDNIVILTGHRRINLAKEAINKYNVNTIILDDGFQHMPIKRDLDIVLIDSEKMLGNNTLLPTGPLREPLSAINRADAILITNKNNDNYTEKDIPEFIKDLNKPIFIANYTFDHFINLKTKELQEKIETKNVLSFCGIGQPEYFTNQIKELGYNLTDNIPFTDHQNYTLKDINAINALAKETNAEAIITTEKDAVKIIPFIPEFLLPVYVIKMKMDVDVENILKELHYNA